jgi:chloramphenicol O-acetyltransferase type A
MRKINMETWPRRQHFEFFRGFDHPHFGLCANVDLTAFYLFIKQHKISFSIAIVYLIARTANTIPEFRYRIRSGEVVEHEVVHPSSTILVGEEVFSFCTFDYSQDFSTFAACAAERIAFIREHPVVENEVGRDDLLYMTAIPWVSFTGFMHPMHLNPADSVPRFAWGKFFEEGAFLKMPLAVQGHHALMDGVHVGKFYAEIQAYLNQPEGVLNNK